MARRVLPQPALPHTRVGRPAGRPPAVSSSRPAMPVGALARSPLAGACKRSAAVIRWPAYLHRRDRWIGDPGLLVEDPPVSISKWTIGGDRPPGADGRLQRPRG